VTPAQECYLKGLGIKLGAKPLRGKRKQGMKCIRTRITVDIILERKSREYKKKSFPEGNCGRGCL
jgi:hypothetical protein